MNSSIIKAMEWLQKYMEMRDANWMLGFSSPYPDIDNETSW